MQWLAHDQEVTDLSQQAAVGSRAPNVLGKVGSIHRATDTSLWKEARAKARHVSIKGVIEIAIAGGQIFFGLGGQQEREVAAWA